MAFSFCNSYSSFFLLSFSLFSCIPIVFPLSTISISENSNQTVICALNQQSGLNCTRFPPSVIQISPAPRIPFAGVVAGDGFICALSSPSASSESIMVCWRFSANGTNMTYKRIYDGPTLKELESGNSHICGVVNGSNRLECWQWRGFNPIVAVNFSSIAVGENFLCGFSEISGINCTGSNQTGVVGVEPKGNNYRMVSAGFRHACALSVNNSAICWGDMVGEIPNGKFISLALGENRSCALRFNGTVVCWGENNFRLPDSLENTYFTAIEAKRSVFCGVLTSNYSLFCWGNPIFESNFLVFEDVLPGPCRSRSECPCGPLPDSTRFCDQGVICSLCQEETPPVDGALPPPPPPPGQSANSGLNGRMVAFLVVGCVGMFSLVLVFSYLIFRYREGKGSRVHDSGRLDEAGTTAEQGSNPPSNSQTQPATRVLEKRLSQLVSFGNGSHLEDFPLQDLLEATNSFSEDQKIGTGSFGSVYHGTLNDGREVAIKRAETSRRSSQPWSTKHQDDKDHAFINELESLSRINHKNLVRLHGFYDDANERVLVYEYMQNGSLHDHLHKLQTSPLLSWCERIRVALDAARGIQYLHEYVVPPIIHRDIKSSNILLDSNWTGKVSDFGLSLIGPEGESSHLSLRAAGTVGYMDPEYYRLQKLTTKSDVYSFGIVLLELVSGYKAIHKNENGVPRNVVDIVVPYIERDEIHRILDPKVPTPTPFEIEVVKYVGYLAADCVVSEGRHRPSMNDIVNCLETALAACLAPLKILSRSSTETST